MFVDLRTIAQVAGIDARRVRKAVSKIVNGDSLHWRGYPLIVKEVYGRGGQNGRSLLVDDASLPPDIQEGLKALQTSVERLQKPLSGSAAERTWWLEILGPALETEKGSRERKAALQGIAAVKHFDWHGRRINLTVVTLKRRLARMEREGIGALVRYGRNDKGEKRVFISRKWDSAVPFDDETKAAIAGDLQQHIRGLVKSGFKWGQCVFFAGQFLAKATHAHGFRPADQSIVERICEVPKSLVSAEMHYRKVHRHSKDRKASEDDAPRIKRTIKGMRPMDVVVMDVHPIDIRVTRADGTTATPKLLGFLDVATQRVWCELIFFDARGGVRNVDLIDAFLRMAEHPAFGLPKQLYCDNGKEYGFADFLDDALKLVSGSISDRSRVTRALPYNAAAKPIEQWFGRFEQLYLAHLPGWIGGDRMNSRQEAVGKVVAPFEGGFDAFKGAFFGMLRAYEAFPQKHGQLGGKSPQQAFAAHVNDGWQATVIDPENLLTVFTRPEARSVRAHAIDVAGRTWTGDALNTYFGDKVIVRMPIYHGFNALQVEDPQGNILGVVWPQEELAFHDPRGAQRSSAQKQTRNRALTKLRQSAPDIDPAGLLLNYGADHSPIVANEPAGTVKVRGRSDGRMIVPAGKPAEGKEAAERRERREIQAMREQVNANLKRAAS